MTVDPQRRQAICLALEAADSLLPASVRRDTLAGLCVATSTELAGERLDTVRKEIDHIIASGGPILLGGKTFTGYTKTDLEAAVVVAKLPAIDEFTTPEDDDTDVAVDTDLVVTFTKDMQAGVGTVYLKQTSDDAVFDSWSFPEDAGAGAGQFEIEDEVLTLHLSDDLDFEVEYYVVWTSGVVTDLIGQYIPALTDATAWSFVVVADE